MLGKVKLSWGLELRKALSSKQFGHNLALGQIPHDKGHTPEHLARGARQYALPLHTSPCISLHLSGKAPLCLSGCSCSASGNQFMYPLFGKSFEVPCTFTMELLFVFVNRCVRPVKLGA